MPILLGLSCASLVALMGAALAHRSFLFFALCFATMLLPVLPRARHLALGVLVSWAGIAACVVSIVLVPLGARVTAVYLPAIVLLFVRILILRSPSVVAWAGQGR